MTLQHGQGANWITRVVFLTCLCALSWLGMQVIHELGHMLAAWITGRTVVDVVLHPLRISETVIQPQPVPAGIIWAGPIFGCVVPVITWGLDRWLRRRSDLMEACLRFFIGFCLMANGAYLGSAIQMPVGDAFDLLQRGTPLWQLVLFGVATFSLGLWMWDGLRRRLGIGGDAEQVSARATLIAALALATVLGGELAWN